MATTTTPTAAKLRAVVSIVASRAKNPQTLIPFAAHQKHVSSELAVTDATARKYLQGAVAEGLLIEVKPRQDWAIEHAIPGSAEWPTLRLNVYADGSGGSYWVSTSKPYGRPPAQSLSFLITPEQRDELARIYRAEAEDRAAKEAEEEKAKKDGDRAEVQRRDSELLELLDELAKRLPHSDVRGLPRKRADGVITMATIASQDTEAFKAVLRAAFSKEK